MTESPPTPHSYTFVAGLDGGLCFRCAHCGAVSPPYRGKLGPIGFIQSKNRWASRHTAECPESPLRGRLVRVCRDDAHAASVARALNEQNARGRLALHAPPRRYWAEGREVRSAPGEEKR